MPAISVPNSAMVPVVAINDTVPLPPSLTTPGMVILSAFSAIAAALIVPATVSKPVS